MVGSVTGGFDSVLASWLAGGEGDRLLMWWAPFAGRWNAVEKVVRSQWLRGRIGAVGGGEKTGLWEKKGSELRWRGRGGRSSGGGSGVLGRVCGLAVRRKKNGFGGGRDRLRLS